MPPVELVIINLLLVLFEAKMLSRSDVAKKMQPFCFVATLITRERVRVS